MDTSEHRMFRVALAQANLCVGDIEGNARKITQYIVKARKRQADLVAFPELSISGYPPEDLLLKSSFVRESWDAVAEIARETEDIIAVVGFPFRPRAGSSGISGSRSAAGRRSARREPAPLFNAAAVLRNGKVLAVCKKILLPNYGVFDEKRYFAPGEVPLTFQFDGFKFGINVCEDIWSPQVSRAQAAAGALVIVNISSSPYHMGKGASREEMLSARSRETGTAICYVNLVGGQDELVFDGESVAFSQEGKLLARASQFEESLLLVDVDVDEVSAARAGRRSRIRGGSVKRGAVESAVRTVRINGRLRSSPFWRRRGNARLRARRETGPTVAARPGPVEEVYRALVLGTRDYVRKNGFDKVAIGLSGGIDSSLVAAIAVDAVGPKNVRGVLLPSRYTSSQSLKDAGKLASNLGIRILTISIDNMFSSYLETLKAAFRGKKPDVTEENIQARIRGNVLMALSNKFGWLVLTTGNKSEVAVGYSTLYGDTAGGFAVIRDVPKTLVYELAGFRNSLARRSAIPRSVITRAPTAELKPGQTDQDSLPPYDVLDPVLEAYVEKDRSRDEIVAEGFAADLVDRVISLVDSSEYKRRQAPPGIKITPKAFGKDRRMPITNLYRMRKNRD